MGRGDRAERIKGGRLWEGETAPEGQRVGGER